MGTRPEIGAVGIVTDQLGRQGEALQVIGLEGGRVIRGRQLGIGVRPRSPGATRAL
jgi:hypothetical protein